MKIVYNDCFGGFGLSNKAKLLGQTISGNPKWAEYVYDMKRNDPILVRVVEELGAGAGDTFASLGIRDVPAGTKYRIDEYDGSEAVMTVDDYEWEVAT